MRILFKKIFFISALILLCLLNTHCGFKLRSKNQLPQTFHTLYLSSDQPYDKFIVLLKQNLRLLNVKIAPSPQAANVSLRILTSNFSYSSPDVRTSDKSRSYSLTYQIQFELANSNGEIIYPKKSILLTRQITISQGQTLHSNNELNVVKQEMQREMVSSLLNHLEAKKVHDALK